MTELLAFIGFITLVPLAIIIGFIAVIAIAVYKAAKESNFHD